MPLSLTQSRIAMSLSAQSPVALPVAHIAQELARHARLQADPAHPAVPGSRLFALAAQRCQPRPATRDLWHSFLAAPDSHMAALTTWLEQETQSSPGFSRQLGSAWQHVAVMAGRGYVSPDTPQPTPRSTKQAGSASPVLQSLPDGIRDLWALCMPDALTQSLTAFVEHNCRQQSLVERARVLAQHMTTYLRLAALPAADTESFPRYFDALLLALLEDYLQLPPLQAATRSAGLPADMGENPAHAGDAPPALSPTSTWHVELDCPAHVWAGTPLVPVTVRLARSTATDSSAHMALQMREDIPVRVWLTAPGFDMLGPHMQTIQLGPHTASLDVEFELQPLAAGRTFVAVHLLQDGTPLGVMAVPVEIAEHTTPAVQERHVQVHQLAVDQEAESPDLVLFVHYDTSQAQPRLLFNLYREGTLTQTYPPLLLHTDPGVYHEEIYRRLSDLTDLFDLKKHDPAALDHMHQAIRNLGQGLWNDLIPQGLQELYALERDEWRDRTLLVITDEPYIPWELIWPYGYQEEVWEDEAPWCFTMHMTRWLQRDGDGKGLQGPPTRLPLERFAFVGPTDVSLAAVDAEGTRLRALMQQAGIQDASPDLNSLARIQELLEAGVYDWFHLASHGEFSAARPDTSSAILLEGKQIFTPETLIGPRIQGHLFHQRPGFVLNACHTGRQGWALTQLGGWVNRLVGSGAGLFLGPLWTITDESAKQFALHFYTRLLDGATVAEAMHYARSRIRASGDPTWLAYTLYAHPNARWSPAAKAGPQTQTA